MPNMNNIIKDNCPFIWNKIALKSLTFIFDIYLNYISQVIEANQAFNLLIINNIWSSIN